MLCHAPISRLISRREGGVFRIVVKDGEAGKGGMKFTSRKCRVVRVV